MKTTNIPTISSFVIDGNTHAPPIIMTQPHLQARPLKGSSLLSARGTPRSFYFPVGKSAPTDLLVQSPSLYLSRNRTSRLCDVKGQSMGSQIPETRWPVNADFPLSSTGNFPIAISVLVIPSNSSYRLPMLDTPKI
jgi:hypothetical protein